MFKSASQMQFRFWARRRWAAGLTCAVGLALVGLPGAFAQGRSPAGPDRSGGQRGSPAPVRDQGTNGGQRTNPAPERRDSGGQDTRPAPTPERREPVRDTKPAPAPDRRDDAAPRSNPAPQPERRNDGSPRTEPARTPDKRNDSGQRTPQPTPNRVTPDRVNPGTNDGQQASPAPARDRQDNGDRNGPAPVRDPGPSVGPQWRPSAPARPSQQNSLSRRTDSAPARDGRSTGSILNPRPVRDARSDARVIFTMSAEGRRFENGVRLREMARYSNRRLDSYFPGQVSSYPYYEPAGGSVGVVLSPFGFYFGVAPPYIERSHVVVAPPQVVYVEVPVYVGSEWRGYRGDPDGYYLNRAAGDRQWLSEPGLRDAVYSLEDAFGSSDIMELAPLTDPGVRIAVFSRGQYQYSLNADDYLDMTRDFMRTSRTTGFTVYRVHRSAGSVYQVFARHSYLSRQGQTRTVYLCMVMERIGGRWTITQVDASPDRLDG